MTFELLKSLSKEATLFFLNVRTNEYLKENLSKILFLIQCSEKKTIALNVVVWVVLGFFILRKIK